MGHWLSDTLAAIPPVLAYVLVGALTTGESGSPCRCWCSPACCWRDQDGVRRRRPRSSWDPPGPAVMVTVACGSAPSPVPSTASPPVMPASGTATVEFGGRQITVHVPAFYRPARPAPLIVALHGYSSNAKELESYLRLTPESERRGFLYAYPDGSTGST